MNTTPTILLIEDTSSLQMVYESVLRHAGYQVHVAGTAADGLVAFRTLRPRVVLLDLMLPDRDGLDLMRDMLALQQDAVVIVITANGSINKAVQAMRMGAQDFLVKPFDEQRFLAAIKNAHIPDWSPAAVVQTGAGGDFIGNSIAMKQVYSMIEQVARSMAAVFITGESGTGKELCAQAIHDLSPRAARPFIALNCGAIPRDLLESEVFGHLKGSFTGALSDKPGAAAAADGGTLFLDEICEMDMALQTKMLRFLQSSTITPVGATAPRKVNVRILCATNRDPQQAVRQGQFREDLYYRLHVVPIHMPPLRLRGADVMDIANHALARFSAEEGRSFTGFDDNVAALFQRLRWPGNVRQLLNVIRNVVVLHDGPTVRMQMLPIEVHHEYEEVMQPPIHAVSLPGAVQSAAPGLESLRGLTLAQTERLLIEDAIAQAGGSLPQAARVLGVSPSTLYRKREAWDRPDRAVR